MEEEAITEAVKKACSGYEFIELSNECDDGGTIMSMSTETFINTVINNFEKE